MKIGIWSDLWGNHTWGQEEEIADLLAASGVEQVSIMLNQQAIRTGPDTVRRPRRWDEGWTFDDEELVEYVLALHKHGIRVGLCIFPHAHLPLSQTDELGRWVKTILERWPVEFVEFDVEEFNWLRHPKSKRKAHADRLFEWVRSLDNLIVRTIQVELGITCTPSELRHETEWFGLADFYSLQAYSQDTTSWGGGFDHPTWGVGAMQQTTAQLFDRHVVSGVLQMGLAAYNQGSGSTMRMATHEALDATSQLGVELVCYWSLKHWLRNWTVPNRPIELRPIATTILDWFYSQEERLAA